MVKVFLSTRPSNDRDSRGRDSQWHHGTAGLSERHLGLGSGGSPEKEAKYMRNSRETRSDLLSGLWEKQEYLLDHPIKVRPMCLDHGVKIAFTLLEKLGQDFPRARYDLQLAIRLHLANEMYHFSHDDANLVPIIFKV